jgi:hypothetical protein
LFDRRDHPTVPTWLPAGKAALGGQRWPKATAQWREASLRAVRRLAMMGADGARARCQHMQNQIFEAALGIAKPWYVAGVAFDAAQ